MEPEREREREREIGYPETQVLRGRKEEMAVLDVVVLVVMEGGYFQFELDRSRCIPSTD